MTNQEWFTEGVKQGNIVVTIGVLPDTTFSIAYKGKLELSGFETLEDGVAALRKAIDNKEAR